ncbi:DinB family protein [Aneurinibacillus sp. Ricciae_BoGa-3]|uniref:DinB family protein n=1 Tax=Aneurinibacillus sp. Ricciae_BoGa-3 TaxID=3022697 RepID=UPI00234231CA|nr:DinB family protein [Aneurinibacillus sp. Ricciae_BoGa-3]WCK54431.1 DinB family protein [Aneurinibacillus sp. Ricciae_BoGa-3]
MSSTLLFAQFTHARNSLLKNIESVTEAEADHQPEGFNNTIRWNIGHILTVDEQFMFGFPNRTQHLPANYKQLFGNGTKPFEWTEEPPSLDTLKVQLQDQADRITSTYEGRLDENLPKPVTLGSGRQYHTYGELFALGIYHEASHTGIVQALKKIVANELQTK